MIPDMLPHSQYVVLEGLDTYNQAIIVWELGINMWAIAFWVHSWCLWFFLWRDWELLCFEKGMAGGGLTSGFIGGEDCEWGLLLILNTKSYVPISLSHSKFRPSESLKTWEIVWVHHFYTI